MSVIRMEIQGSQCRRALRNGRKLLTMAKAGKYNGYLLEGNGVSGRMCGRSRNHANLLKVPGIHEPVRIPRQSIKPQ